MLILLTSHRCYIAVTGVLCEFSYKFDIFLTYIFYIVLCAYSLGVFTKKPHQNWEISRKIIQQLAYIGQNDVNKNISQGESFWKKTVVGN